MSIKKYLNKETVFTAITNLAIACVVLEIDHLICKYFGKW